VACADRGKVHSAWPVYVDHAPCGQISFKVRVVSSSMLAHAASEIGASSRCRLFMPGFSFEGADSE
jgi:hypothetical protein